MRIKSRILMVLSVFLALTIVLGGFPKLTEAGECCKDVICFKPMPLQPVQVVWQEDPLYPPLDMQFVGVPSEEIMDWRANLPMMQGKNTLLFGSMPLVPAAVPWHNDIFVGLMNLYTQPKDVRVKITVNIPGVPTFDWTSPVLTIPAGQPIPDSDCNDPGQLNFIPCPDGMPANPFRFTNTGDVTIEVIPVSEAAICESPFTHRVTVKVKDENELKILYVPVRKDFHAFVTSDELSQMSTNSTEFILGTYPLAENEITGLAFTYASLPYISSLFTFGGQPTNEAQRVTQRNEIFTRLATIAATANYDRIVGVLPGGGFGSWWGHIDADYNGTSGLSMPANPAAVLVEVGDPTNAAHEIGHTYGLGDEYTTPNTGNTAYGYWVNKRPKNMDGELCFMGNVVSTYAQIDSWIDKNCYRALIPEFETSPDPEVFLVSGRISQGGAAEFDELLRLPYGRPDIVPGPDGAYSLVLMGESQAVLGEIGFDIDFREFGETVVELDIAPFMFRVLWIDGTRELQLRKNSDVLATRSVSANPPSVTITYPNGGEILNTPQSYTMTWDASDPDPEDTLTYDILFSDDSGNSWLPMAMDLTDTSFNWDTEGFPSGTQFLIKVIASDGANTDQDTCDNVFTIAPPQGNGLAGDATGDGTIDATDITKVERIIAGLDPLTTGADANQDGNINALDITKVERLIAGLD